LYGKSYKELKQLNRSKLTPKFTPIQEEKEDEPKPLEEKEIKEETKNVLEEKSNKVFEKIEKIEKKRMNKKQIKNRISAFLSD